MRELLTAGADKDARNLQGMSPVNLANRAHREELAQFMEKLASNLEKENGKRAYKIGDDESDLALKKTPKKFEEPPFEEIEMALP